MSLVSWIPAPRLRRSSTLNNPSPPSRRELAYARPTLEHLEERALLDASSGLIGGATNNLALNNNFNLSSNGVILPTLGLSTGSASANGADASHSFNFSGLASSGTGAQAASSAFLAQSQPNAQFRLFAVNSQGQNYQLFQQTQLNFLANVYGFGSGTWPNRPWEPAAYNVGLANRQFNYPSQADNGFQSAPTWSYPMPRTVPIAQAQHKQLLDEENGETVEKPEQAPAQKSMDEQEDVQPKRLDRDADYLNKDDRAPTDEPASEKAQLQDQALNQEKSFPEAIWFSILAPAPMPALVAGLPGATAEAEGGDDGGASSE